MRYVSTFSGVEAATLAWRPLGWEALCFAEVDPFPSAVLRERFPEVPNFGDVTKVDWRSLRGTADLVVGGSPCQSFSVAGSRTGLDGASGLMWEYVRCVREVMPRWLLWENVPGALSSSHGEDFRCLLASLDELGYGLAWRVLDAQFFGVAQRRRRVFLVGSLGDRGAERACSVLFEPEGLRWDLESGAEKRKALAAGAGRGAACSGFSWHLGPKTRSIGYEGEQSPTLTDSSAHPPAVMCMTDTQPNASVGDICGTLSATMGRDAPVSAYAVRTANTGANGSGISEQLSHTVDASGPEAVAYAVRIRDGCAGGGKGPLVQEDVSGTLATGNDQTVFQPAAFAANQRGEVRLQGGDGTVFGTIPTAWSAKQAQGVMQGYVVRRLTPRECERLQGMPDDWTRIPWRGKPAEECPDGPRYKAIGNSMAVPVMRWIGERIDMAERMV